MSTGKNDNESLCYFPEIVSECEFERVICYAAICGPGIPLDMLALLSYDGGDDDMRVSLFDMPRNLYAPMLSLSFVMEALEACRVHLLVNDNDLPPAYERLGEVWQAGHSIITPADTDRDICLITLSGPEDGPFPVGLLFRSRKDGDTRFNAFRTPIANTQPPFPVELPLPVRIPFPVLIDALNTALKALEQAAGG